MSRRANSEGSVYQRKSDGKWCASATFGGRRKTVYGSTQKEALAKLRLLQQQIERGVVFQPGRELTVARYLNHWTEDTLQGRVASGRLAPATLASYRDQVRLHLIPDLGSTPLAQLTVPRVRSWLTNKQGTLGHRGTPLSARSVAYLHAVLRAALADAVRDELIPRNVCLLVEAPRAVRRPATALSTEEVGKLLAQAQSVRLRPLWVVLLALGLRKGEALALHWTDVDLAAGTVRIHRTLQRLRDGEPDPISGRRRGRLVERQTTKTGLATTMPLPVAVVRELEAHRRSQLKERLSASFWADPDLVFTTGIGTALEPRNVTRAWRALCVAAGVEPVRVHDLRHTAASLLLQRGVDLKVVQQMLRHSRLSTTADIYAHVNEEMERAAAAQMDEILTQLPSGS